MVIGPGVYHPQAKFAIPRSYVRGIDVFLGPNALVVWTDNDCFFQDLSNPSVTGHLIIAPEFVPWSSNRYTLDFLPLEWYYVIAPSPVQNPANFYLNWGSTVVCSDNYFVFNIFGVGTVRYRHELPGPPAYYWYTIPPDFPP